MSWGNLTVALLTCNFLSCYQDTKVDIKQAWQQWGGPTRNFRINSPKLADFWPEKGPPIMWKRSLGDGHSTILVEKDTLYTMYRDKTGEKEGQEVVVSLDSENGNILWEYRYDEPLPEKMNSSYGPGPNSTPLIVGEKLFSVGVVAKVHALDKKTGQLLWSRDLYNEFSMERIGNESNRGYSSSPIAYKDLLIFPVGGLDQSVIALRQNDGSVAWKKHDFQLSPSSPILIEVNGQKQVILFMGGEVIGLNPANGDLYWSYPHSTDYDCNISTPLWGEDNLLYVSSAYNSGSRVLELTQENGLTAVQELFFSKRMKIHFGNTVRIGNLVYGSSGAFGPAFFMAMNVRTGKIVGRQRGFAKAQFLHVNNRFVILDEKGLLVLATPGEQGLKIHSKFQVFNSRSWTAPTLVGSRLYVRNRETILALELGERNLDSGASTAPQSLKAKAKGP